VLDGDLSPPTERGRAAPTFRPMSIVAKRWPISATAELSLKYASEYADIQARLPQYFALLQTIAQMLSVEDD